MYVLIVGAGRVGTALARWLLTSEPEHEVTVIDRESSRCAALEDDLGSISVTGDGTEAGTLTRAGANRADVFIATMGADEDNLVACQLAKHLFGAARTISLVNGSDRNVLFNRLGIDVIVDIADLAVGKIQGELSSFLAEEVEDLA